MSDPIPTTERLAQALEALEDPRLADMILKARAGYYDDFKSELTTPLVQLYHDLTDLKRFDMLQRVMDGEFDSTPEESRAWFDAEGHKYLGALGPLFETAFNPDN